MKEGIALMCICILLTGQGWSIDQDRVINNCLLDILLCNIIENNPQLSKKKNKRQGKYNDICRLTFKLFDCGLLLIIVVAHSNNVVAHSNNILILYMIQYKYYSEILHCNDWEYWDVSWGLYRVSHYRKRFNWSDEGREWCYPGFLFHRLSCWDWYWSSTAADSRISIWMLALDLRSWYLLQPTLLSNHMYCTPYHKHSVP
jgi:hypothetical protein